MFNCFYPVKKEQESDSTIPDKTVCSVNAKRQDGRLDIIDKVINTYEPPKKREGDAHVTYKFILRSTGEVLKDSGYISLTDFEVYEDSSGNSHKVLNQGHGIIEWSDRRLIKLLREKDDNIYAYLYQMDMVRSINVRKCDNKTDIVDRYYCSYCIRDSDSSGTHGFRFILRSTSEELECEHNYNFDSIKEYWDSSGNKFYPVK